MHFTYLLDTLVNKFTFYIYLKVIQEHDKGIDLQDAYQDDLDVLQHFSHSLIMV